MKMRLSELRAFVDSLDNEEIADADDLLVAWWTGILFESGQWDCRSCILDLHGRDEYFTDDDTVYGVPTFFQIFRCGIHQADDK